MSPLDDVGKSNPPEGLDPRAIAFFIDTMVGEDGKIVPIRLDTLIRKVPQKAHPELIAALMIADGHTEGDTRQTLKIGLDRTFQRLFSRELIEPGFRSAHIYRLVAAGLAMEDDRNYDRIVVTPKVQWLVDLYVQACEREKETEQLWLQEWSAGKDGMNGAALKCLYDVRFDHNEDVVIGVRSILQEPRLHITSELVGLARQSVDRSVLSFTRRPDRTFPIGAQTHLRSLVQRHSTVSEMAIWELLELVAPPMDAPQA